MTAHKDETLTEPDGWLSLQGDFEHAHKPWMDESWQPLYTAATLREAIKGARRKALEEAANRIEAHKTGSISDLVMDAFAQEVRALLEDEQ